MKCAIITDQHFGARKGSKFFHEYFLKFYNEVFFPTLERESIRCVIDMGDTFDNRRSIDLWSLEWAKKNYYDRLRDMGVDVYTVVGNHTAYYKNTNDINTVDLLLREYSNVVVISSASEKVIDGRKIMFLPWINDDNRQETYSAIDNSTAEIAMGHLELNGFRAHRGHVQQEARDDTRLIGNFKKVFSGHYHTRSDDGKVFYLGNPYEMFWNDVNDTRGFHIFDTETLEHTPVNNPFRMFYNVYYDDTPYQMFDATEYAGKIVKIIVRQKSDPRSFEKFVDKISSVAEEVKVIENFAIEENDDFEVEESENTMSILHRYIDESETELDKSIIKKLFEKIYREACEVE
jgi:hypothetical protein